MKMQKKIYGKQLSVVLLTLFAMLFSSAQLFAETYTSCKNGDWKKKETWVGEKKPPTGEIPSDAVINIKHEVKYNSHENIKNEGTIRIEPDAGTTAILTFKYEVDFENHSGGELYVINGEFRQYRFKYGGNSGVQRDGNFKNIGGYVKVENSFMETPQDFTSESGGTRDFINSCVYTGQNYSVSGSSSKDTYDNVTLSLGWHGSGNFQLSDGEMDFDELRVQLAGTSGNFQLSSGHAHGNIDFITMKNIDNSTMGNGSIQVSSSIDNSPSLVLDAYWANSYQPHGMVSGSQSHTDLTAAYFTGTCVPGAGSSNNPPVAVDDSYSTPYNTVYNSTSEGTNLLTNDSDPDGDNITINTTPVSNPSKGSVTINSDGTFVYTPDNGETGTDTFVYEICDDGTPSMCDQATVTITIDPPVNNPPVAVDDAYTTPYTTPYNSTNEGTNLLTNDSDPDGDDLTINTTPVSGPSKGSVTINTDGTFVYTPDNGETGTDTFVYEICDDGTPSKCDQATVTITIQAPGNNPPDAVDDSYSTPLNTPVTGENIMDNDSDPDGDDITVNTTPISGPSHGNVTLNADGTFTYTPNNGYTGTDSFDYEICDDGTPSMCDQATVNITITTNNDSDGDGCTDDVDDYPDDPTRCFDNYYPPVGNGTLAYEDLWPGKGDYDFNDLVCDYRFKTVTNASNKVVEIFGTFIIKAFGAGYQNGFAYQLANDNVDPNHITVTGYDIQEGYITLNANGLEDGQSKPTIIVYDNAFNIMAHPGQGIGVNTDPPAPYVEPDTVSIYMDITDNIYTMAQIDIANFNPFIIVDLTRGREVHLPSNNNQYPPTDLADDSYFGTFNDDSDAGSGRYYKTANNLPWAINIVESFAYPKEKKEITTAYNFFSDWAESGGIEHDTWYKNEPGNRNDANIYQVP